MSGASLLRMMIPSSLLHRAVLAGSIAVVFTAVLEMTSLDHVGRMRSSAKGRALYASSLRANLFNNLVLGPMTYYTTIRYFCRPMHTLTLLEQMLSALGMVICSSLHSS